jgi:hypothetical protein
VILTAINFFAVLLFVPETRFQRDNMSRTDFEAGVAVCPSQDDIIRTDLKASQRTSGDEVQQLPKKTFVQELSLWSGTSSTSLFKMFIRYVYV